MKCFNSNGSCLMRTVVLFSFTFSYFLILKMQDRKIFFRNKDSTVMLAVVSSNSSIKRAESFYRHFHTKIEQNKHIKKFLFFTIQDKNHFLYNFSGKIHPFVYEVLDTVPIPDTKPIYRDLANKFASIIRTFLEETDCDYLIRITDDVYINFDKFEDFMKEITSYGDPRKKNLIVGDVLLLLEMLPFIQGGSGFVISRKAAMNFMSGDFDFLRTTNYEEDQSASHYALKYTYLKPSMRFIGHVMLSLQDNKTRCTAPYYPIGDVVFFHHLHNKMRQHTLDDLDNFVHNSSRRMWQQGFFISEMCRGPI